MTNTWLTPLRIIDELGGAQSFDLDPCAAPQPRPWDTARRMNTEADGDGLALQWEGRVWLNPPYSRDQIGNWMWRMARHGCGTALVFARVETSWFARTVWEQAHGLLFVKGRLRFHKPDGTLLVGKNRTNSAGAPSVLIAYGQDDLDRLAEAQIEGAFVPLKLDNLVLICGPVGTWAEEVRSWLERQTEPVTLSRAYRHFSRHPKSEKNPNWKAKIRQTLQLVGDRVDTATYGPKACGTGAADI